jgi:hypothetical protein
MLLVDEARLPRWGQNAIRSHPLEGKLQSIVFARILPKLSQSKRVG